MRSDAMGHQLLPKRIALPIFASDALSSVAYAPDEVLLTLALAGTMAAMQSIWVGVVVALVLAVVVASYRQTVHAYPSGGGDYEVVTKNLGRSWGLLVASALLVDYILTVAVSISSGASYITTAVPALAGYEVPIAVGLVNATPSPDWYGLTFRLIEDLTGSRIVFTSRLGTIRTAEPDFVVQEHDQLYFAINGTDSVPLRDQLSNPPKMEE